MIFLSFKLPEPHLGQDSMVRQDITLFVELQFLRTMDQVLWLDQGSYFHSAILVTTSWSCFVPLGGHLFHSQSLLWPLVLVPSHPGPATFCPCWKQSLVLTWFPWNCRVNGICCLDPTPLQIMTLCAFAPCTMINSVKEVRCQCSSIDCLIASTRRSSVPISPGGSNRTICVGPKCW